MDETIPDLIEDTISSPDLYLQILAVAITALCSWLISRYLKGRIEKISEDGEPQKGGKIAAQVARVGSATYHLRELIFPVTNAILLGVAVAISREFFDQQWLVQFVQGLNFLSITYIAATRISTSQTVRYFALLVLVPLIILYAIGLLDNLVEIADGIGFSLGNIEFTLYALGRTVIFGVILFWIGRLSNQRGADFIRGREALTETTKELVLKTFQIGLFVLIALIILQIAGIDLTALVVFGGAIGVGLGFGLQQIASNFISGIIILLDRSIAIGDYIELEDGRAGTLRELTMRSATLETYDGKDIMVPNEKFITTAFTNWTHNNQKQRYPIVFEVAYGTDLEKLFTLLRDVVGSHPSVLSGDDLPIEERPDAEVQAFNANGIEILVEFWMEGVDDGRNRVGGDLLFMIYQALLENDIEIPFPQREVVIKEDRRKKS
ncbi:MAG: mechanosensitive ion channel [Rhodospirillales bacterium]|nr:mechanosensitive ion channel [Rhodospirillales bacterium]MBO6787014.1 mechanosensitive ion channel [Rhodospirillales bacterium]